MTKQELIERVFKQKGLPRAVTKKMIAIIVEAAFDQIGDYFVKSKPARGFSPRLTIPGFGTFTKRKRAERVGRNPKTGERVAIPESWTVTFVPGTDLKALLNRK